MSLQKKRAANRSAFNYQSLEARQLLANIAVSNAYIVDDGTTRTPIDTVVVGQKMALHIDFGYDVAELTRYSFKVAINGSIEAVQNDSLIFPHWTSFTVRDTWWYSTQEGVNVFEIWADHENEIEETNEDDNYFRFEFTAVVPKIESPFTMPVRLEDHPELSIGSYGTVTPIYQGSIDAFGRRRFAEFRFYISATPGGDVSSQDIPVYAMADGIVEWMGSNGISVRHESSGLSLILDGLRNSGYVVKPGQAVKQGQLIGYFDSTRLEVFAEVAGRYVNLFAASQYYFDSDALPSTHPEDRRTVFDARISNYSNLGHSYEGHAELSNFHPDDQSDVFLHVHLGSVFEGDQIDYQWRKPDGSLFQETHYDKTLNRSYSVLIDDTMITLPDQADVGQWSVDILVNGQLWDTTYFEVSTERLPEIRVEHTVSGTSHWIVTNNRRNANDLGLYTVGEEPEVVDFFVINHGTAVLNVADVRIPAGFVMTDQPETILPGESANLSLKLDKSMLGHRVGEVRIISDDADEGVFSFWIEGQYLAEGDLFDVGEGRIALESPKRDFTEGDVIPLWIRYGEWSSDESADLTVNLEYLSPGITGPETVVIPYEHRRRKLIGIDVTSVPDAWIGDNRMIRVKATIQESPQDSTIIEIHLNELGLPSGTSGDDVFVLNLNGDPILSINGKDHTIDPALVPHLVIDGQGGRDRLEIVGSSQDETVYLSETTSRIESDAFTFELKGAKDVRVLGNGGNDEATLVSKAGLDTNLYSEDGVNSLTTSDFRFIVEDFDFTRARSFAGSINTAIVTDSVQDDKFYITPGLTRFEGPQGTISAVGFSTSIARSFRGGNDEIVLIGTEGDDQLYSDLNLTSISGKIGEDSFHLRAVRFEKTVARTHGGDDFATFAKLPEVQVFSNEAYSQVTGSGGTSVRALGLENLIFRTDDAQSRAIFDGSAESDDVYATPSFLRLRTPSRWVRAQGFGYGVANGMAGYDRAEFVDSLGDDRFRAAPGDSWMQGEGFFNRARQFERISATSRSGNDIGVTHGTDHDDYIVASARLTRVSSENYFAWTSGFMRSTVLSNDPGFDIVKILDTPGNDRLFLQQDQATMFSDSATLFVDGVDRVVAVSNKGGVDELFENFDLEVELIVFGSWN